MNNIIVSYNINNFKTFIFRIFEVIHKGRNLPSIAITLIVLFNYLFMSTLIDFDISNYPNTASESVSNGFKLIQVYNFYQNDNIENETNSLELVTYILCGFFAFLILMISLSLFYYSLDIFLIKIISQYYFIILEWVLILPMVQILRVNSGNAFHIILSIILIKFNSLLAYCNPISNSKDLDKFTFFHNRLSMLLFYIKYILLLLRTMISQSQASNTITLIATYVCLFFLLNKTLRLDNSFNILAYKLNFLGALFLIERTIISTVNFVLFMFSNNDPSYYFVDYYIGSILLMLLGNWFYSNMIIKKFLLYPTYKDLEDIHDFNSFMKYYNSLFYLLFKEKRTPSTKIHYLGLISNHSIYCKNSACPLRELASTNEKLFNATVLNYNNDELNYLLIHFLEELFVSFYRRYNRKFYFNYIYLKFLIYETKNYEKALISIENLKLKINLNFSNEFQLYILKNAVNNRLVKYKHKELNSYSVNSYLKQQYERQLKKEHDEELQKKKQENDEGFATNTQEFSRTSEEISFTKEAALKKSLNVNNNNITSSLSPGKKFNFKLDSIQKSVLKNKEDNPNKPINIQPKFNTKTSDSKLAVVSKLKIGTMTDSLDEENKPLNLNSEDLNNLNQEIRVKDTLINNHPIEILNFKIQQSNQHNNNLLNTKKLEFTWSYLSIYEVLENDRKINQLKNLIYQALQQKLNIWKMFSNNEILVDEIYDVGEKYFDLKKEIINCWEEVFEASNNNVDKSLELLYINFMKIMFNIKIDRDVFYTKRRKMFDINLLFEDELYSQRFKNNIGIVVMDVNPKNNFHVMTYTNNLAVSLLEYSLKSDLVGKDLNLILPDIISSIHPKLIKIYIETGKSNIQRKTLELMIVKKSKALLPVNLVLSFLPSLNEKIEGIAIFSSRNTKNEEMIITDEYGKIDSVTKGISNLLSFQPGNFNYYIESFIPEILSFDLRNRTFPEFFIPDLINSRIKMKVQLLVPISDNDYYYSRYICDPSKSGVNESIPYNQYYTVGSNQFNMNNNLISNSKNKVYSNSMANNSTNSPNLMFNAHSNMNTNNNYNNNQNNDNISKQTTLNLTTINSNKKINNNNNNQSILNLLNQNTINSKSNAFLSNNTISKKNTISKDLKKQVTDKSGIAQNFTNSLSLINFSNNNNAINSGHFNLANMNSTSSKIDSFHQSVPQQPLNSKLTLIQNLNTHNKHSSPIIEEKSRSSLISTDKKNTFNITVVSYKPSNINDFAFFPRFKVKLMKANFIRYEKRFLQMNLKGQLPNSFVQVLLKAYKLMINYNDYSIDYNVKDVVITHMINRIVRSSAKINTTIRVISLNIGNLDKTIDGDLSDDNGRDEFSKETFDENGFAMSSMKSNKNEFDVASVSSTKSSTIDEYLIKIREQKTISYASVFSNAYFSFLVSSALIFSGIILFVSDYSKSRSITFFTLFHSTSNITSLLTVAAKYSSLQIVKSMYDTKLKYDFLQNCYFSIDFSRATFSIVRNDSSAFDSQSSSSELSINPDSLYFDEKEAVKTLASDYFIKNDFYNELNKVGQIINRKYVFTIKTTNIGFSEKDIFYNYNYIDTTTPNKEIDEKSYYNSARKSTSLYEYIKSIFSSTYTANVYRNVAIHSIFPDLTGLKQTQLQFLQSTYFSMTNFIKNVMENTKEFISYMFIVNLVLVILSIVFCIFFLYKLYESYNLKYKKNAKILSLFKHISNESIDKILREISKFKSKYFTIFEQELIESSSLGTKIVRFTNITDVKYHNVGANEETSFTKKLVENSQLSIIFILKVLFIVICYIIALVLYITNSHNSKISDFSFYDFQTNLVYLNLLINYANYETSYLIYDKLNLIKDKTKVQNYTKIWKSVEQKLVSINIHIYKNKNIFGEEILETFQGNICQNYELKYCINSEQFNITRNPFIKIKEEAFTSIKEQFKNIDYQKNSNSLFDVIDNYDINNKYSDTSVIMDYKSQSYNVSNLILSLNENYNYTSIDIENYSLFNDTKMYTFNKYLDSLDNTYTDDGYLGNKIKVNQLYGLNSLVGRNLLENRLLISKINQTDNYMKELPDIIFSKFYEQKEETLDSILFVISSVLYKQLTRYIKLHSDSWRNLIIICCVVNVLFVIGMYYMLREVLKKIYKQESLSKKLLGEIPDYVLRENMELTSEISFILRNDNTYKL